MIRRSAAVLPIVASGLAAGCGPGTGTIPAALAAPSPAEEPAPAAPAAPPVPWIDFRGTSIVGFGILRVVPPPSGEAAFRIRYREVPDGYATTGNLQLFVLPGDAFAAKDRAYASEFLAFARTEDEAATDDEGALRLTARFTVSGAERTVLVCYGPWTAPDAGRPAGDVPTFSLDVDSDGGAFEWVESEAGELITTNWTNRPGVARGGPVRDPREERDLFLEVRPMILYDGRLARAPDEPPLPPAGPTPASLREEAERLERQGASAAAADRLERAADLEALAARNDRRLVLVRPLVEKFRRVPIRWR